MVDDPDGDVLTVSGSSSNLEIVPNENIVFGGSRSNRTVTVTPAEDSYGTAIITVMVSDGDDTVSSIFELAVIQLTGRICFRSTRNGNTDIYVMNADGTGQTQVTDDEFYNGNQTWSPDGQRIVYASVRDGNGQIFIMNADGTNVTRITENEYSDNDSELSPDGTRIVSDLPLGNCPEFDVIN